MAWQYEGWVVGLTMATMVNLDDVLTFASELYERLV